MTSRKVSVWYDHEGDMLEVLWAFREGYFTPTDDERILKRLDDDGEVIGFLIHEMSTVKQPTPLEFELASETPADAVINVTARQAADELGISDRRLRQLARDGRLRRGPRRRACQRRRCAACARSSTYSPPTPTLQTLTWPCARSGAASCASSAMRAGATRTSGRRRSGPGRSCPWPRPRRRAGKPECHACGAAGRFR